ncbi:MAG: DUF5317 family protein [Candidatus Acetothermia bacterium]
MFFLWAVVIGLLIGLFRGGSLNNLDDYPLRGLPLVLLALVVQVLIFPLFTQDPLIAWGTNYLHFLSYGFLAVFVLINLRIWQVSLMGIGGLANLITISVNGGYMPASVHSLQGAGQNAVAESLLNYETYGNVIRMSSSTYLNFFGDWLYIPDWLPLSTAFSLGDLLVAFGLVAFLGIGMVSDNNRS